MPPGCEEEIEFLLQKEDEFLEMNNNKNLPVIVVTTEKETEHAEKEILEQLNATTDSFIGENLSIFASDLDFNSPTSSFTIPSPLSSAVSSTEVSLSEHPNRRGKTRTPNHTEWNDLKRKALKNSGKAFFK